ncbi:MAG: LCP family protein [Ilumatobacteraceae bacterium]
MHTSPPAQPAPRAARRPSRVGLSLLVIAAFTVAGVAGTLIATRNAIATVVTVPEVAAVLSPPSDTVENFLLVGSDSRANSDPTSPDYGGIGSEADVTGSRSDTIMVLRRDKATGEAALLSIPRDLWVDIPGKGTDRINSAYAEGPAVLVQTVQDALGLPVHHYVEIDFSGFKQLVDAVGGVELCFFYPTRDTRTGLDVPEAGCHTADGVEALSYARSRYFEQYIDGEWKVDGTADIGRTKRQQDFVDRALRGALATVKANPFVAGDLLEAGGSAVRVDDELDLLQAASSLRPAVDAGLATWSLPIVGTTIDGKSVLQLGDGAAALLDWFAGRGPAPAPPA